METRYAVYRGLAGFACQAPVFALWYAANGLSYGEMATLALAFAAAKLLLDVPAGAFADRMGRRAAILARVGLECVSVALMFDGRFLAASALAGAACACSSGAEQALVYEWAPSRFARTFGRGASWSAVSAAAAALAGAAVASVDFSWVYLLRLAALVAAGAVVCTFSEPPRALPPSLPRAVRTSVPRLGRTLAFVGIVGAVQVAALPLQQPFLREAGVPLAALGVLYVAFQLATAAGARLAERVPSPLALVATASAAGFALMALPIGAGGVAAVFLLKLAHGVAMPAVGRAMNDRAPSSSRATALSLRSLFEGAALAVAAPLVGWAADAASLHAAFAVAAVLVLPSFFFLEASCVVSAGSRSPA